MNSPLIKWTGSKRSIANQITSFFPTDITTYYEPFLGGGSVLFYLLKNQWNIKNIEASDKNESLIDIFNIVKLKPNDLINSYKEKWTKLQQSPAFFYNQREEYNKTQDPFAFYFLTRTCYNGTIRYNKSGEFNTSHHFGRAGMRPEKVKEVILYYSFLMKNRSISFTSKSFESVNPTGKKDVLYLDPPYTNTKALYFGNISLNNLISWLRVLDCNWFMNINGVNVKDNEEKIDLDYTGKAILNSGNSSFSRMKGNLVNVGEYFYYKLV